MLNRHFDRNPADDPAKCGLTIVATISWDDTAYQFDETIVWQDNATGGLYMASDSGCSCPSPFEDFHCMADLERVVTIAQIDSLLNQTRPYGPDMDTRNDFRALVQRKLQEVSNG